MARPLGLRIEGARQNNLRNISLEIPHDRLTVITGVSGSGKSSLAFDTLFAEGQWRYIESLSTYARMFLDRVDRPDVDRIEQIRPAVALEQKNPVRTARSTVGTATEVYDYLRLLYAKVGPVHCPSCGGPATSHSPDSLVEALLAEHESARALIGFRLPLPAGQAPAELWAYPSGKWYQRQLVKSARRLGLDLNTPYQALSADQRRLVYDGNGSFPGIQGFFEEVESYRYKLHVRVFLSRYRSQSRCPTCTGTRLRPAALAVKVGGLTIADFTALTIARAARATAALPR